MDWSADRSTSTASVAHVKHDALGISRLCSAISCSQTPRELMHAALDDMTETMAAFPNMVKVGAYRLDIRLTHSSAKWTSSSLVQRYQKTLAFLLCPRFSLLAHPRWTSTGAAKPR